MPRLADYKRLPRVSILVPLWREAAVAEQLLEALAAMDYPAPLLDIKLVLEADDETTRAAIARSGAAADDRGGDGAAGHAADQAAGDELRAALLPRRDRRGLRRRGQARPGPDPRGGAAPDGGAARRSPASRATSTSTTPPTTGSRAASRSNTRSGSGWCCSACSGSGCRSRSAAPRVFFRRRVLEEIGAWDAHNVTEDADLGMRLARFGYRCEMIASTTWEEANCHGAVRWIGQRSRWLKGYAITWATPHARPGAALARPRLARASSASRCCFSAA